MNKLATLTILFLIATSCGAAEWHFEHFGVEDGLSHDVVRATVQDETGFLWIATEGGLNRYDGFEFTEFRFNASEGSAVNVISDLAMDSRGHLWMATLGSGLVMLDTTTAEFTQVGADELSSLKVAKIFIDSKDNVWAGTLESGLNLITTTDSGFFVRAFNSHTSGPGHPKIKTVTEDASGQIWVGTDGGGIYIYQYATDTWQAFSNHSPYQQELSHVRSLLSDKHGNMWIGTADSGVFRYSMADGTITAYRHDPNDARSLVHDKILDIFLDRTDKVWIATDGGLSIMNEHYFENVVSSRLKPDSLSSNRVLNIFQDRAGLMWFSSYRGLNKWNPATRFFNHQIPVTTSDLEHSNIVDFSKDSSGALYLATYGGGVVVEQEQGIWETVSFDNGGPGKGVVSVFHDNQDGLWVGTFSKGLFYRGKTSAKWRNYRHIPGDPKSLPANGVSDIFQDSRGDIWVATFGGGISKKSEEGFLNIIKRDSESAGGLTSKNIFQVIEDADGSLLLASDNGVNLIDPIDLSVRHLVPGKGQNTLRSTSTWHLYKDKEDNLWIATQGHGVYIWPYAKRKKRIGEFQHLSTADGLPHDMIYGVAEDNNGDIWMSTARGLGRVRKDTFEVSRFNIEHGLQGYDFNLGAAYKDEAGIIYFGGANGFNSINGKDIVRNEHKPNVQLVNITVVDKSIPLPLKRNTLTLNHKDYFVAFDFVALDFSAPERNQYQYQLESFDKTWIHVGNLRRATYTNLPAGNYVFKVRAANNDGIWSEPKVHLELEVIPAPWFTPAAFLVYALMAATLLFSFLYRQMRALARKDEQRRQLESLVAQRTEELGKQTDELARQNDALKMLNTKLERVHVYDPLTGIHNRYFLDLYLEEAITNLSKAQGNLKMMVLLIDIDNLKHVNDSLGHAAGDAIISRLAKLFSALIPPGIQIVRWGGDEFMIVGEVNNNEQSLTLVNKLIAAINEETFVWFGTELELSCSMGFAYYPFDAENPDALTWDQVAMLADKALLCASEDPAVAWCGVLGTKREINELYLSDLLHCKRITQVEELVYIKSG